MIHWIEGSRSVVPFGIYMSTAQLLSIVSTLVLSLLGAVVGYLAGLKRDQRSKRREIQTQYLIEAYRRLESSSNRSDPSPENGRALESAVADVQLFGSSQQVKLAKAFAGEFAAHRSANIDELLARLRTDLREELDLEKVTDRLVHLRIDRQS